VGSGRDRKLAEQGFRDQSSPESSCSRSISEFGARPGKAVASERLPYLRRSTGTAIYRRGSWASVLSPKYVHVSLRSKWAAGKAVRAGLAPRGRVS
jgi:hypothetical protein